MTEVTIYHNPRCSKSRQTLALLEEKGYTPRIVPYLESPPDADTLKSIVEMLGVAPMDIIRTSEAEYDEAIADLSVEDQIGAIVAQPKLMQRPIVVVNGRAKIGRPPEGVLEILEGN